MNRVRKDFFKRVRLAFALATCLLTALESPGQSPESLIHYKEGKRLLREGRPEEAQGEFLKAIDLAPRFVEAHRAYQQVSIYLFAVRPLLERYDALLRAHPNDPMALYLNGRLRTDPDEQKDFFVRAVARDGRFAWGFFGLAHVAMRHQKMAQAVKLYRKAITLWDGKNPTGFVGLGLALLRQGRNPEAAEALRRATALEPDDSAAWLLYAKALARTNQKADSFRTAARAIALEPENSEAHDFCRQLLICYGTPTDYRQIAGVCQEALRRRPETADLYVTLAFCLHHVDELSQATEYYQKARALGASPSDYANDLRLLYVRQRRYAMALEVWQEKVSPLALTRENRAWPRYQRLFSVTQAAEKTLGNPDIQMDLARAYEAAGWLDEARAQYTFVRTTWPNRTDAAASLNRLDRHQEFCKRVRRLFDENYFNAASGKSRLSFRKALHSVHQLAEEVLGAPIEGKTEVRDFGLLGKVSDFGFPPRSGLQEYFWRYNQFLALGQPFGEPVQCVLLNVISWEPNRRATVWGRSLLHDRIVAENAGVRTSQETVSDARIGGQAVDRIYYVDLDRVWEIVTTRINMVRKHGGNIEKAARELPWPSDPLKVRYLSCIPQILQWQSVTDVMRRASEERQDARRMLFAATLADIDAHELGHVLDAMSYVPISAHIFEDFWLFLKHGFSVQALMGMTEHNAQLTAMAHAPEPRSVLAGALIYVAQDQDLTQHALGYYDLVRDMVRHIADHPKSFPEIDVRQRILDQVPRLLPDRVRALAQAIAHQNGLPQRAAKVLRGSHVTDP